MTGRECSQAAPKLLQSSRKSSSRARRELFASAFGSRRPCRTPGGTLSIAIWSGTRCGPIDDIAGSSFGRFAGYELVHRRSFPISNLRCGGVEWTPGLGNAPLLTESVADFQCRVLLCPV